MRYLSTISIHILILRPAQGDEVVGIQVYDDRLLFEFLILEGAQAELSWSTILKKRGNYRRAFDNFEIELVTQYDAPKVEELLSNPGIVRNRLKINSAIKNAQCALALRDEYGSLSNALWQFVDGIPKQNEWNSLSEIHSSTPESNAMSKFLLSKGFKFVGSTICYAFMQAVGMVNHHSIDCFRYKELGG